jgi:hypothetical protein
VSSLSAGRRVSWMCCSRGPAGSRPPRSKFGSGWVDRERTVSRVLSPLAEGVAIYLGRRLPGASSDRNPRAGRAASSPPRLAARRRPFRGAPSYLVLLRAGFAWPAGHPAAGGLLPHHFTLTGHNGDRRCHFCGTFLRVTPTGRYPAPCSTEPGLSSPLPSRKRSGHPSASTRRDLTTSPGIRRSRGWPARPPLGSSLEARV